MSVEFKLNLSGCARILGALFALPADDPELACSQFAALSRQIPLFYGVVTADAVALAATHVQTAPPVLTLVTPAVLVLITTVRLIGWLRVRNRRMTGAEALQRLRLVVLLSGFLGSAFSTWAASLFPYGDAYAQCQVVFFIAVTTISCIFGLMHLRGAALLLTTTAMLPLLGICLHSHQPVLIAMALNMLLITIATMFVMFRNYRDFTALIVSKRELIRRQRETQRLSDETLQLANLDSLTSLPNRRRFFAELDAALVQAEREGRRFAVALIDLDRFKNINDVYGHVAGDRLLTQVGLRLKRLSGETVFIARLGGDEFGAILRDCETDCAVLRFGADVQDLLRGPCVVGDRLAEISCSMGVAIYPTAGGNAEQLFERADYALFHGKQKKKGGMVVFSREHETVIRQSGRVEQAFRTANLDAEIWVAFQPVVDIVKRRIIAFEALARWASAELGPIGPDVFIPLAERSQMIGRITAIMLGKGLAAAKTWPAHMGICFNLSAHDLISDDTMKAIRGLVLDSGIAPSRIEFEVTETALLQDFEHAARSIDSLHALGARISLDDFGTGFSSLGYVHRLPLDKIKIDRSFVADVDISRTSPSIIKTVVDLCHNLELDCVVEGVETESQLRVVTALGCQFVQGYLLSRPVPGDAVPRLIEQMYPLPKGVSSRGIVARRALTGGD